jgi:hypothetical protein
MKIMKQTLLIGSSFAGGLVAGYLLSGNSKLKSVKKRAGDTFDKTGEWVKNRNHDLQTLSERVKRELRQPIPDLYRATESLSLSEEEIL